MIRLQHQTQKGGEITYQGPLAPPGEPVVLPVDEHGIFEAPAELAAELQRILGPDVAPSPDKPRRRTTETKEVDA